MAVNLSPVFNDAQLDSSGNPFSGALLFTYTAGSAVKLTTYQDSAGNTAHSNPIQLNSRGEPPAPIWLTAGSSYKFRLCLSTESDPPSTSVRDVDNVSGVNDTTVTADEWATSGLTPTYVSATSFTLTGDQTTEFHEGRRLKITDAGGTKYCTVVNSAYAALTTVTVAGDSLATPTSAVSYSLLRASNPSVSSEMVYRKATAVASAATCDIWATAGDYVHITGSTGPITSFGTAPYAGAERTVIFDSTPSITHNATSLVLPGGVTITAAANDRMVIRADTTANMIVTQYTRANATPHGKQATRQVFTTGSGTYTTPSGATRINVRMIGGGGGGQGVGTSGAGTGGAGGDTTFSTLTASGGAAAAGAVGTGTNGDINISGALGGVASTGNYDVDGGIGGSSAFGGGGAGGAAAGQAGRAASANTGAGGGGAGGSSGGTYGSGAGGSSGGYVEKLITSPSSTYSYAVGAAGTAGGAGTGGNAGGAGGSGLIIVDEYYD